MKKPIIFMSLFVLVMNLHSPLALSLESLSSDQMKNAVAQAGVSIAINDVVTENYFENIGLYSFGVDNDYDPGDPYLSLNGVRILSSMNSGGTDMNGDGLFNHLTIDFGSIRLGNRNQAMVFLDCLDLNFTSTLTVEEIDFFGTNIGSMSINDLTLSSFHLYMGPHAGTGIDFELGLRMKTDSVVYNYNSTAALTFSNIQIGRAFSGDPSDPSRWIALTSSTDQFMLGDIEKRTPATIDFISENSDKQGFVALNLPMTGSIRVGEINFGGNNFGSLAIDGLKAEKLYIELPGRGLGK